MPSFQPTADDVLPQREGHDNSFALMATDNGEEEGEQPQLTTSAASARALLACSAASWPLSLKRLSFATELLPLPEDVAEWMRSGGRVWLPEGSAAVCLLHFF